jgi:hypothetical protein
MPEAPIQSEVWARKRGELISTLIVAAGAVCLWVALGSFVVEAALKHDFLNIYTGASLALEGRFDVLHDPAVQFAREREIAGDLRQVVPFVRPAFYAALLSPLALLPYRAAFVVWLALQSLLLAACLAWAWRRWGADAFLWGILSLPAALGIAHGQDGPVMLAAVCIGYELLSRGRPQVGGAAWSFGLVKFHLWLVLPVALAARREWRVLRGFAGGAAALAAAALLLGGFGGAGKYARLLTNKELERLSPTPENMWNLQGIAENFALSGPAFFVPASAAVLLLAALALRRAPLWRTIASGMTAGLLVAPHVYGYDATMLLLAVWLTMAHAASPWTRRMCMLHAVPLTPLATLLGKPFAAIPALVMLSWLAALAAEGLRAEPRESSSPAEARSRS